MLAKKVRGTPGNADRLSLGALLAVGASSAIPAFDLLKKPYDADLCTLLTRLTSTGTH